MDPFKDMAGPPPGGGCTGGCHSQTSPWQVPDSKGIASMEAKTAAKVNIPLKGLRNLSHEWQTQKMAFPTNIYHKARNANHTKSFSTKAVISNYFQSFTKEENWETEIVGATYGTGRKGHWAILRHLRTQETRGQVRTITLSVVGCKVLVSSLHQSLVWLEGVESVMERTREDSSSQGRRFHSHSNEHEDQSQWIVDDE